MATEDSEVAEEITKFRHAEFVLGVLWWPNSAPQWIDRWACRWHCASTANYNAEMAARERRSPRRWFQFRLGALFLLTTLVALWLAWELSYIRERKSLRAALEESGATVISANEGERILLVLQQAQQAGAVLRSRSRASTSAASRIGVSGLAMRQSSKYSCPRNRPRRISHTRSGFSRRRT